MNRTYRQTGVSGQKSLTPREHLCRSVPCSRALLGLLAAALLAGVPVTRAGMTVSVSSEVIGSQAILPSSGPTAVASINANATTPDNTIRSADNVSVSISGSNFSAAADLVAVYLFRDSGVAPGKFGYDNIGVNTNNTVPPANGIYPITNCLAYYSAASLAGGTNRLGPVAANMSFSSWFQANALPGDDAGANAGADFFIVVQTSDRLRHGASFTVTLNYTPGPPPATPTAAVSVTTGAITCEYWSQNLTDRGGYHGWSWGMVHLGGVDGNPFSSAGIMGVNTPYLLFGLNLAARSGLTQDGYTTEYLTGLEILFQNTGPAMFASHMIASYPDVSVWEDTNNNGVFDPSFERTSGNVAGGDAIVGPPDKPDPVLGGTKAHNGGAMTPFIDGNNGGAYSGAERVMDLEGTTDGRIDFFICLTTDPSHIWVTSTPVYGDNFDADLNDTTGTAETIIVDYSTRPLTNGTAGIAIANVIFRDNTLPAPDGDFDWVEDDAWIDANSDGFYTVGETVLANPGAALVSGVTAGVAPPEAFLFRDNSVPQNGTFNSTVDDWWVDELANGTYNTAGDQLGRDNTTTPLGVVAVAGISVPNVRFLDNGGTVGVFDPAIDDAWADIDLSGTYTAGDQVIRDNGAPLAFATPGLVLANVVRQSDGDAAWIDTNANLSYGGPAGTRSLDFWYARQKGNDPITATAKRVMTTILDGDGNSDPVNMTIAFAIDQPRAPNGILDADGFPAPIFSINLADGTGLGRNESIETIRVWFSGADGFKPTDIMPLTDDQYSGIGLWWDNKLAGIADQTNKLGQFDPPVGVTWLGASQAGQQLHSIDFTDTNLPLSSGSLTWYNSDSSVWSPQNDDPAHPLAANKEYYVVLHPKDAINFPPNDYYWTEGPEGHSTVGDAESFSGSTAICNRGADLFICVRANGFQDKPYSANWWERGMDKGDKIKATIKDTLDIVYTKKGNNTSTDALPRSNTLALGTLPLAYNLLTTYDGYPISPYTKTAVVGLNLVSPPGTAPLDRIQSLVVELWDVGTSNFDIADLIDPTCVTPRQNQEDGGCGIAVYIDNPVAGQNGVFDPEDIRMPMAQVPYIAGPPQLPTQIHLNFVTETLVTPTPAGHGLVGTGGAADQATGPVPGFADRVFKDLNGNGTYQAGVDVAWVDTNHSGAYESGAIGTSDVGDTEGNDFFLVIQPTAFMDPGDDFALQAYNVWFGDDRLTTTGGSGYITTRFTTHRLRNQVVTNDILTDETTPGLLVQPNQGPFTTIGINVYDPLGIGRLNALRVYFNPQGDLDPNDLFATLAGGAAGGLSLWNTQTNANIPLQAAVWHSDIADSLVYHQTLIPPTPPASVATGTVLDWFAFSENVCWADNDQDGKWSTGDALWANDSGVLENGVRYNHGYDTALTASAANDGDYGIVLQYDLYGFSYYDADSSNAFSLDEDIYFLGPGRDTLGWYTDLVLSAPVALPPNDAVGGANEGVDFDVRFRTNPNPPIFGTLGWTFSLPNQSLLYNTGHSEANKNLNTTTIRLQVTPTTITDFTATRGSGRVTLNWTLPTSPFISVMIVRTPTPAPGLNEVPFLGVHYAVGQPVGRGTVVYLGSGTTFADSSVVNGTPYYYWAFASDRAPSGRGTEDMVTATPYPVTPTEDSTPPGIVTGIVATPGNNQVLFTWNDPLDLDLAEVLIVRSSTDYPVIRPANETGYAVGANLGDGLIVGRVGPGAEAFTDDGDAPFLVPAPVNGTTYYYTFYTRDGFLNYSAPAFTNCMPSDGSASNPLPLTSFSLSAVIDALSNHDVNIAWTWPPAGGIPAHQETGLIIVRQSGGSVTGTPSNGRLYELGDLLETGEAGTVVAVISSTGTVTYTDQDVLGGATYYYAAFTHNSILEYSAGAFANQVVSSVVVTYLDFTTPGQTIEFDSNPTAVLGINLYDNANNAALSTVTVQFNRLGNNSTDDLADILGNSALSGVALYRDNGNGTLDGGDTLLPFSLGSQWSHGRPGAYDRKMDTPILDLTDWHAVDAVPGTQAGISFYDQNNNGMWDGGEDIWAGANPLAAPGSTLLYTGGTLDVALGNAGISTGLYYFDEDGSNSYTPGESVWRDESWPRTLTMNLTTGVDVPDTDPGSRADVFVVLRTSRTIRYGTQVQLAIPGTYGVTFFGEEAGVAGLTTNAITSRVPAQLTNLVSGGQTIPVKSPSTPVIAMDAADPTQTFDSFQVQILNVGGLDVTPADFVPYSGLDSEGPISLWRDLRPYAPSSLAGVITATATAGGRTLVQVTDTDFAALGVREGDAIRRVAGTTTTAAVTTIETTITANDTLVFDGGLTGTGDHSLDPGDVFTVETTFLAASSTVLNLTDASHYPAAGLLLLGRELIAYSSKSVTGNDLLGCVRGDQGTAAALVAHPVGESVRVIGMQAGLADVVLTAAATTINLTPGQGARFPDPDLGFYAYVRIDDEIIGYRDRSGDQLRQCARGARGSDAVPHLAGATAVQDAMSLLLAADLGPADVAIDLLERPFDPAAETGVGHVTIGLETISYSAVIRTPLGWRLLGCVRGSSGTTAAAHLAGYAVIQGRLGVFDLASDSLVSLASAASPAVDVPIPLNITNQRLNPMIDGLNDFFLTVKTSASASHNDDFQVQVIPTTLDFSVVSGDSQRGTTTLALRVDAQDITPPRITGVRTLDLDRNGLLDHALLTFSEPVDDSTLQGYVSTSSTFLTTQFLVAGYTGVGIDPNGTTGQPDSSDDNRLLLFFNERSGGAPWDTGDLLDISTAGSTLTDLSTNPGPNVLNGGTEYVSGQLLPYTADGAAPVLVDAFSDRPLTLTDEIAEDSTISLVFSEPVTSLDLAQIRATDFRTDPDGVGGAANGFAGRNVADPLVSLSPEGYVQLFFDFETTAGGAWTEDATVNLDAATIREGDIVDQVGWNALPAPAMVHIRGLGSVLVISAETGDNNHNGRIDFLKITFDRAIQDSSVEGYAGPTTPIDVAANGNHWLVAGRAGVMIDPNGPTGTDIPDNDILYLTFTEGGAPDTFETPALTISGTQLTSLNGERTRDAVIATTDAAPPVMLNVITFDMDSDGKVDTALVELSEKVLDATVDPADFTIAGVTVNAWQTGLAALVPDFPNVANDEVIVLQITIGANEVPGTDYKTVAYRYPYNSAIPAGLGLDTADLLGNPMVAETDGGRFGNKLDAAKPTVQSARTLSDSSLEVVFSENVLGITLGMLTTDSNALSFGTLTQSGPRTYVWSNPAGSATWNTDATGSGPGDTNPGDGYVSTNSSGAPRSVTPNLTLAGAQFSDAFGNVNAPITNSPITTDGVRPVVVAITTLDESPVDGRVDSALIVLSEPMSDGTIAPASFRIGGTTATTLVTGSANDQAFTLRHGGAAGTDLKVVAYTAGTAADLSGNLLATAADLGFTKADGAKPRLLTARTRSDSSVELTFSELLTGLDATDLTAAGAIGFAAVVTTANPVITWTGATTAWNTDATGTAAGTGTDATGTTRPTIPTLTLAAGAVLDQATPANGIDAIIGSAIATDAAPPVVVKLYSTVPPDSTHTLGQLVPALVQFSERVTVTGAPTLTLQVAAATQRTFPYVTGSGSRDLRFNYTVDVGDNRRNPDYLDCPDQNALSFGGGNIIDFAPTPNRATLTLPLPHMEYAGGGLYGPLYGHHIQVDTVPPTVQAVETIDDNTVKVTFSELIENSANEIAGALASLGISDGGAPAATLPFDAVSLDEANGTPVTGAGDLSVIYLHMNSAAKRWNTDATGSSAGVGTDAAGTHLLAIPKLIIAAAALRDTVANPIAATSFDATTDGAPPVIIPSLLAGYYDTNSDGTVDQLRLLVSEPVNLNSGMGWTLTPNALAINAAVGTVTLSAVNTITLAVTASAPETGVDNAAAETEPSLAFADGGLNRITDRSPAASPLADVALIPLADRAGPVLLSAEMLTQTVIRTVFSEKLAPATVVPTDFTHSLRGVNAVATVNDWAGARLTLALPVLSWNTPATLRFAGAAVVTDPEGNGNAQITTVPPTPLNARVDLTGPLTNVIHRGSIAIPVTGLVDILDAPPEDDLTSWSLYLVQGHGGVRKPIGDISSKLLAGPTPTPVGPGVLGTFTPDTDAALGVYQYSLVLTVAYTTGEPTLEVYREIFAASGLPQLGTVNDGLGADVDFQPSTSTLAANWTGVTVVGVPTDHYAVAVGTTAMGFDVVNWTNVGLVSTATLPGLSLSDGAKYHVSVRAIDAGGTDIAIASSDGVIVDAALPTAGTVLDGAAAGIDITWQASDSSVAANWSGFADPGATDLPPTGSNIASYEWALFAQAGATPVPATDPQKLAWTNVGNVAAAAANLGAGALAHGQLYYAAVRALDAVGNQGLPAYSDGFRPDLLPSVGSTVRDGLAADIDITSSLTTLSGNWDAFTEPDSGLSFYQYRIATDVHLITAGWERRTTAALGALNQGRTRFGVARLADGRTMALGGWTGVAALATVEVYNPTTGAWTFTGSLQHARYGAAVVALPDGDVIVAGGSNGSTYLSSVERYNHLTASWSHIASLSVGRENATAALMADGSVWFAGGRGVVDSTTPATTALSGYRDVVERLALPANTVTLSGTLSQPRAGAAAYRLADGRLVVFGGENVSGALSTTDVYTPGPGWSTTPMPTARVNFAHVQLPNGDLLAIGGTTSGGARTAAVDRFDTATGTWLAVAPMATARSQSSAAWVESTGTVLVTGGINAASAFEKTCEEYNPDNDLWATSAPLNRNRGYHSLVSNANGLLIAFGGLADWLITGETEVRRLAAPVTAWTDTTATNGTVGSLSLALGRTYYFQVRAFDNVGNRSDIVTSDGVTVSSFSTPPVLVTLVGPANAAVGEAFNVMVYVREDNDDANGFRGGPLDLSFTASRAQVTVDGGFSPSAVLSSQFTVLGEALTSGTLNNAIGLIDELGGATTANGLGEETAPGVLYATIPFRATSAGTLTIAAGPGLSGLVLTPPIGAVPADATSFGAPLSIAILQGVTLTVDGGVLSVNEGGSYRVRATLTAPATEPVTVVLGFAGTATLTTDYTVTGLPLVIAAGATSAYVTVQVANDGTPESNETAIVRIDNVTSGSSGYAEVDEQSTSVTVIDTGRPGDANGDGRVDYYDLLELISEYGKTNPGPTDLDSDFDGDGDVDYYDLLILIANFGATKASDVLATIGPKVTGPTATVSLVGPVSVVPGATFNVDVYVQVSSSSGFGGGPLDIDFSTAKVDYSGAFSSAAIIQAPFNSIATSGTLNEALGQVAELGGATIASGHGHGAPVFYARLTFRATASGTATFTPSAGTVELRVVGDTIPFANTTYGSPLSVTIAAANYAPTADHVTAQTGVDQAVDLTLSGADADGNALTFNLPTLGQAAYPAHGDLSNSRPGTVAGTRLVTYTPDPGYSGSDSFTYTVNDGTVNSPAATVGLTIGGFLADVVVTQNGGAAFTTLRLGMQPDASDSFMLADGDYLAAPPLASGGSAYLLAPFGEQLGKDIRGLGTAVQWKLAVGVPGSVAGETWNLAWQPAALPAGALCFLTPADATWTPTGVALDMKTASNKALVNGTATTKTLRFLITVATKQTLALSLKPGWNLIGIPLTLDEESIDALFSDARLVALYQYSTATGYTVPADVTPGRAYWAYASTTFSVTLSGVPASGPVSLTYGWNLVAPYTTSANPMDGISVLAVWAWDPVAGYYIPERANPASILSTMGIWVFAAHDTTIWDDGR